VPSYPGLATLGHELGHAYHNVALENRPPLQRNSPSTLAETASIFCETLIRHAALTGASESDELVILEGALQDAIGSTIEVTSRFLFEQRFFEARKEHDVPVSAICELMRQSQIDTYGDGLDPELLHTYMWAAKGHYYSVDESYYNFPYMFGLLFGLGLYHQYMHEPAGFTARYDELLSSTGRADAAELGATFGLDLRKIEFWRSSFDVIRGDVARFIELAAKVEVP
jgi:oligoendopeptidase F